MNTLRGVGWLRLAAGLGLALLVAGCATNRVDWNARIGHYTYDEAVLDLGPPDKSADLQDGTIVAEWLTRRGYYYVPFAYSYSPWWYGPYYPAYMGVPASPDYYLRLIFSPDRQLKTWKTFYK